MNDARADRVTDSSHVYAAGATDAAAESPKPIPQHGGDSGPPGDARDVPVPGTAAKRRPESHWLSFVLIAGGVVLLDQISKRYIDANLALGESWPSASWPFRIMHVKNTGAAFSMLQNQTLFLTVMSIVGLGAILLYFLYRPSDHPILRFALALQLGGAIGNLIDRARYGEVTDFFKIPNWPVFNIADSAISVGVVTVVIFLLFSGGEGARRTAPDP
jgi:signal peptidase II